MTTFLLVRHGNSTAGESIPGRLNGVHLSDSGREQVELLAERLASMNCDAIVASPLERTRETAEKIAERMAKTVKYSDALLEIDFGEWVGMRFDELEGTPAWHLWHAFRSGTRIPGGEIIGEVQARMVSQVEQLYKEHPDGTVIVVSHGDPIRSLIAYYIGLPLDQMLRIRIDTASVSTLIITHYGAELIGLNAKGNGVDAFI
jgi:probable phosphoglycerate mutase